MGFERRDDARSYTPGDGDTLRSIAERETAAGNPMTWQELALYNWGTDDADEVEALMRDELGARARNGARKYVLSGDDEPRVPLKIPQRYQRPAVAIDTTHVIRVRRKKCPKQFLGCTSLPAVTFGFNSSFIRPEVVRYLGDLEALAGEHVEARIMIFGHTDAVGDETYNKKLSERRAWSTYGFIVNDPDVWETLYNHPNENWGTKVVQEILADLGHYNGNIDNQSGPATRNAMRAFLGLGPDTGVQNDAAFRKKLFAAYMGGKHDVELGPDRFLDPGYMGCGEFNLLEDTSNAAEANRRVTFYFFHPERLPHLPCKFGDVGPCKQQMVTRENRHIDGFACSFYDSWAERCPAEAPPWLEVYLLDYAGYPMPEVGFKATSGGSVVASGTTNGHGIARLPLSAPPVVTFEWGDPLPGEEGAFHYIAEHHLQIPDDDEGCRRMLANLGYVDDPEADDYVRDFQQEWGRRATGRQAQILDTIRDWHSTGVPPAFPEADDPDDSAPPEFWSEPAGVDEEPTDGECGAPEEDED